MRNSDVAKAWVADKTASTHHMKTDGGRLWSYALVIGFTDDDGSKVLLDYTAPNSFVSMTTSCHIGLARCLADKVQEPVRDGVIGG